MNHYWRIIFLSFLWLISFRSESNPVVLKDSTPDISLDFFVQSASVPAFLQDSFSVEKQKRGRWFKLEIENRSESTFLFEALSPHIQHIHLWAEQKGVVIFHDHAGRDSPFAERWLLHKNFTFSLPENQSNYTLWIAIEQPREGDVAFKIRSFKFFSEYAFWEYFFLGIYYGLLLIACVYNVFLFLKSKINLHLYYALYIVGCIFLSFREDGLGFQFFWPHFPSWNEALVFHLARPIFLATFLLYSFVFLELKSEKYFIYIIVFLSFFYLFFEILSFWNPTFVSVGHWLIALVSVVVYVSSLWLLKHNVYARYFAVGFSMVIISLIINLMRSFGFVYSDIFTVYSFNFGIFLEVVIFSVALAEKVKDIQAERNVALSKLVVQLNENDELQKRLIQELQEKKELQEKVNRELEQKVQERTTELQTANTQLREYAKKLDELNSALDLRNFALKREVKQATISRINVELVDYDAFLDIYPNEQHCMKMLESLKWPNGFICDKCKNTNASAAKFWYRQKCSRCGTIESVTSHTLFHNTRIPLQKAFYISYLTFVHSETTLDELSEKIDLRKATVWLFRKKVEERMEQKDYQKAESWQALVLDKGGK